MCETCGCGEKDDGTTHTHAHSGEGHHAHCPGCGGHGVKVPSGEVEPLLEEQDKKLIQSVVFCSCPNQDCEVAYFGGGIVLTRE
jgi:hypothetical protein